MHANHFRPNHEWEAEGVPTGAAAVIGAAAGLALVGLICAGIWCYERRARLAGLLLLGALVPCLTWS